MTPYLWDTVVCSPAEMLGLPKYVLYGGRGLEYIRWMHI